MTEFNVIRLPGWSSDVAEIQIHMRRNSDVEVREFLGHLGLCEDDGTGVLTYQWSDGNYSCDCNRHGFFENRKMHCDFETPCSSGRYSVNLASTKTGEIFYKEFGYYCCEKGERLCVEICPDCKPFARIANFLEPKE